MIEHRRWTQTDISDLRQRLLESASVADIAKAADRTHLSVSAMMARIGLREIARFSSAPEAAVS